MEHISKFADCFLPCLVDENNKLIFQDVENIPIEDKIFFLSQNKKFFNKKLSNMIKYLKTSRRI